jgi:hypothetical protein
MEAFCKRRMIKRELIRKKKLAFSSTKFIRIISTDNLIISAKKTPCISVKKSIQLATVRKYLFSELVGNKRFFCGHNIELVTLNLVKGIFVNM